MITRDPLQVPVLSGKYLVTREVVPGGVPDLSGRNRNGRVVDMGIVLHLVRTCPVWLTAVMTLIGGLPHFDCRCPDGHLKQFCLAVAAKRTGCCCGGGCCGGQGNGCCGVKPNAGPKRPAVPSCCEHQSSETTARSPVGVDGQAPGCVRTVAQTDLATAPSPAIGKLDFATAAPLLCPHTSANLLVVSTLPHGRESLHGVGPPPDLIALLQHLLI